MLNKLIQILIAITITVIAYYGIIWVLDLLSIHPPERLLMAVFVLIGLVSIAAAIVGRFENWWKS